MLKYLLLLKSIIFTISGNVCPEYQFYCNTLQSCLFQELTCPDRCDLCLIRQSSGENIACINDCDYVTLHLHLTECSINSCENDKCPTGFIIQKNRCKCVCISETSLCHHTYLCPKITPLTIPNDNINGYTVYQLSVVLKPDAYNIYVLYGNEDNPMIIPKAYQVHQHIGANLGGINPLIINYVHDSIFDSWFTISVLDGNDLGYINSIGIPWNDWEADNGLTIIDGAIFLNDPRMKLSNTNEYVIAHLTLNDNENHLLKVNINGKIKNPNPILSVTDVESFNERNVLFHILAKPYQH